MTDPRRQAAEEWVNSHRDQSGEWFSCEVEDAHIAGQECEREAVVRWLNEVADDEEKIGAIHSPSALRAAARAITRGEHLEEKP